MQPIRLFATALSALLAALLLAPPLAAYVVVLQDGSKIVAQEEYEVRDGKAIITLPNGTQTFIDVDEIDLEATEEANRGGYGKALVIEGPDTRSVKTAPEAAERRKTLADLASPETRVDRLEPHRREARESQGGAARTPAGYTDLASLPPRPFHDLDLAAEVQRIFRGQGVDGVELYQGSEQSRLYAEITANSEASVFRTLEVAAEALLAARESHSGAIDTLELFLATSERERAGQFVLTPELARELVAGGTEVSKFYVEHVQF